MNKMLVVSLSVAVVLMVTTVTFADELPLLVDTLTTPQEDVVVPETLDMSAPIEGTALPEEVVMQEEVPVIVSEEETVTPDSVVDTETTPETIETPIDTVSKEVPAIVIETDIPTPVDSFPSEAPLQDRIEAFPSQQKILLCARGNWEREGFESMTDCVHAIRE